MIVMINKEKIKKIFTNAIRSGSSSEKLTLSFCVGLYIAFAPFPGVHTVMMFAATWMFGLNFPIVFLATSVNNPWTMIPFYSLDYFFGHWLVHNIMGWNPTMVISIAKVFGLGNICLWSFLIGGNILGILVAFLFYPLVKFIFNRLVSSQKMEKI